VRTDELSRLSLQELRDLAAAHRIADVATLAKDALVQRLAARLSAPIPAGASALGVPSGQVGAPSGSPQGSSATSAPPAPARRDGPDPGLPIPDRYGRDRLVLMVQDPFHVFAYWEVTPETAAAARAAAGEHGATVLLIETPQGQESREVDLGGGNYYLAVAPGTEYSAQLAVRDAQGRLHVIARSNRVATPSATISTRQDEAWMTVDETFGELLDLAGLPGQSGSSVQRLSSTQVGQRIVTWTINHVDTKSMFSGVLAGGGGALPAQGAVNLSSFSLSSTALYSGALSSSDPQRQQG
jgi:hypothetical protein